MIVVTGRIYAEGDYNGLPDATVSEAGTSNLTKTSNNGSFTLLVNSPLSVIRVSHLGYKDQAMTAGSFNQFVNLVPTDIELDPVEIKDDQNKPNYLLIVGGTALTVWALMELFKKQPKKVTING